MTDAIAKCKLGKRHVWAWLDNVDHVSVLGSYVRFSLKGRYRCACGARKLGNFQQPPAIAKAQPGTTQGDA